MNEEKKSGISGNHIENIPGGLPKAAVERAMDLLSGCDL